MSAQFLDGPAQGVNLTLHTCPTWLRLVCSIHTQPRTQGRWDALDQPDDVPLPGEAVYVYRMVPGTWSQVFVRPGGRYESGQYRHVPDAPVHLLRERAAWVSWAKAQPHTPN